MDVNLLNRFREVQEPSLEIEARHVLLEISPELSLWLGGINARVPIFQNAEALANGNELGGRRCVPSDFGEVRRRKISEEPAKVSELRFLGGIELRISFFQDAQV